LNFDSEMCGTLLGAKPSLGQCSLAKLAVIHYCVFPFSYGHMPLFCLHYFTMCFRAWPCHHLCDEHVMILVHFLRYGCSRVCRFCLNQCLFRFILISILSVKLWHSCAPSEYWGTDAAVCVFSQGMDKSLEVWYVDCVFLHD
jgi:hypothetical protein